MTAVGVRALGPPPAWLWALSASLAFHALVVSAWVPTARSPAAHPSAAPPSSRVVPVRVSVLHLGAAGPVVPQPALAAPTAVGPATSPALAPTPLSPPAGGLGAAAEGPAAEPLPLARDDAAAEQPLGGSAPGEAEGGARSGPGAPGVPGATAAAAASSAAVGGSPQGQAADVLHQRLAAAAAGCYPAAARRYRQEGTATVRFCLDASGALRAVGLAAASGAPLLDAAARDCVVPAALPFPPAAGECFTLPVRFGTGGQAPLTPSEVEGPSKSSG